jgi:hypothetical protein
MTHVAHSALSTPLCQAVQVLGCAEPVQVAKDLLFQCAARDTDASSPREVHSPGGTAVLDLVRLSQEHGVPFQAAVPLCDGAAALAAGGASQSEGL